MKLLLCLFRLNPVLIAQMVGLLCYGSLSYADDTEIFFAQGGDVTPNILIIVDESASMMLTSNRENDPDNRMGIFKKMLTNVLREAKNVNVGIFNMYDQNLIENGTISHANILPRVNVQHISSIRQEAIDSIKSLRPLGLTDIEPQSIYHAARYFSANDFHHGPPSPITGACQANYLIYTTDGFGDDITPQMVKDITGSDNCSAFSSHGRRRCTSTVVNWLLENDQNPYINGKQTIRTHTVGIFKHGERYLRDVARAGGGRYYNAGSDISEITRVFKSIINDAMIDSSASLTNMAISVNDVNKNDDNEDIYYGLFVPGGNNRWVGNLKSYFINVDKIAGDSMVYSSNFSDKRGAPALKADGTFADNAMSRWTTIIDGANFDVGGAAFRLPHPLNRKLLVQIDDTLQPLAQNNSAITMGLLNIANNSERKAMLNYIRGFDKRGITMRKSLGDPLHSTPVVVNYSCRSLRNGKCDIAVGERMVLLGTNEGFVHMFEAKTGVEKFAFMPEMLLPNIKKLSANAAHAQTDIHPYGMDNTVTIWANDINGNGVIYGKPGSTGALNSGEFIYAYATMRRGGRGLYALDITNQNAPELLWHVIGGQTPGFERLGDTWSEPVKSKIKIYNEERNVLIFGGGYDKAKNDNNAPYRSGVHLGNAIYIIDAITGEKIWSASASGGNLILPDMKYSIPARVRVLEQDGLAEQIVVGDTGGQLWRLFINNGHSKSTLVTAGGENGILADLGASGINARRFYHEADVTPVDVDGVQALTVNIGSGYRAHPLNQTIDDRFYSLHVKRFMTADEPALSEHDLYDATSNSLDGSETSAQIAMQGKHGWYLRLKMKGEKILSTPVVVKGELFFNSYVPQINNSNPCQPVSSNYIYHVRLRDATPAAVDIGAIGAAEQRYTLSKNKSISATPLLIRRANHYAIKPSLADPAIAGSRGLSTTLQKSYWIDLQE